MKMCHIVPGSATELIKGPYAMCLAQFIRSDVEYADAYSKLPSSVHLIMDNGLAEDGKPLGLQSLAGAVLDCIPSELVLPDHLDPADNFKAVHEAMSNQDFLDIIDERGIKLMYVPHGRSFLDYADNVRCIMALDRKPDSFGISKFHDRIHPLSHIFGRAPLALLVKAYFPDKPIHYLGLGGPVQELRMLPNGRSCDTVYAFMAAAHDIPIHHQMMYRPKEVHYDHQAELSVGQVELFWKNTAVLDVLAKQGGSWLE